MVVKSIISVQDGINQHLKSAYKPEYTKPDRATTRKSRSGTEILTDLYRRMDDLIIEIDGSEDTPSKKAIAYGQVARILQQLQTAERNAAVHIDNKALHDMTPAEIESITREVLRIKGEGGAVNSGIAGIAGKNNVDFPNQDGSRRVWDNLSKTEQKKQITPEPSPKNKKQQARALASAEARRRNKAGTHLPKHSENYPDQETDPEDVDAILDEIVRGL